MTDSASTVCYNSIGAWRTQWDDIKQVNREVFNGTEAECDPELLEEDEECVIENAWLNNVRNFLFAYVEPLELLYPTAAMCESGGLDVSVNFRFALNNVYNDPGVSIINYVRWFGTINYNFMSYFDCLYQLDGVCAGKKLGSLFYYLTTANEEDLFDNTKLEEYEANLIDY